MIPEHPLSPSLPSPAPLLEADDLRIDVAGAVALERTSFVAQGRSLVLAGDSTALMSALAGVEPVRSGTLRLLGRDVAKREHLPIVGLAPLDPILAPTWTAMEYLTWSARLAGLPKAGATTLAQEALSSLDLPSLAEAKLGALGLAERRVVVLAQAIVSRPEVLVAAMPLAGLSGAPAEYVLRALERATRDRHSILSVTRTDAPSPEHALVESADEVLAFASGRLVGTGKPEALPRARLYLVAVRRNAEALGERLATRGLALRGGPVRHFVELSREEDLDALFAASAEAQAPIVQLVPHERC